MKKHNYSISLYFGLPGSGKSTILAKHAFTALKKGITVYSNVSLNLPGVILINKDMLGSAAITDGLVLWDEAGVDFDSRDYKNFNNSLVWFFKNHRHMKVDIEFFSQGWDDTDKKLRNLTVHVWYVYKPFLTGDLMSKAVHIGYGIIFPSKKETGSKYGEIIQGYAKPSPLQKLFGQRIWRDRYYKLFDSYVIDRDLMDLDEWHRRDEEQKKKLREMRNNAKRSL